MKPIKHRGQPNRRGRKLQKRLLRRMVELFRAHNQSFDEWNKESGERIMNACFRGVAAQLDISVGVIAMNMPIPLPPPRDSLGK